MKSVEGRNVAPGRVAMAPRGTVSEAVGTRLWYPPLELASDSSDPGKVRAAATSSYYYGSDGLALSGYP